MTFERRKELCHYCGEEGSVECSMCMEHFCEKHCRSYRREHRGAHYCCLSLSVCINCKETLAQLGPGELLARLDIRDLDIRYT